MVTFQTFQNNPAEISNLPQKCANFNSTLCMTNIRRRTPTSSTSHYPRSISDTSTCKRATAAASAAAAISTVVAVAEKTFSRLQLPLCLCSVRLAFQSTRRDRSQHQGGLYCRASDDGKPVAKGQQRIHTAHNMLVFEQLQLEE